MRPRLRAVIMGLLLFMSQICYAQSEWMVDSCHLSFSDIKMYQPEGFVIDTVNKVHLIDLNPDFSPSNAIKGSRIGSFHTLAFISYNEDCILLFPTNLGLSLSGMPDGELKACAGNENINTKKQIIIVAQKDMSKYCNADTAYIYRMKLPNPYLGKYTNCIGICLRKYAHPAMLMKVMLTGEGLLSEDVYLNTLLSSIEYGNEPTETCKRKEILFNELMRPNKN